MNRIRTVALASALAAGGCIGGAAWALDGAALYQSKICFSCHGRDARSPILPMYPKLAGQNAEYSFNQMRDIKRGIRTNGRSAAMKGIMHLVTEEEMRAIADWLATLE